jgi:hypothetical protein
MKKQIFLVATFFAAFSASAQEVVSSQGQTYSNSNGSIDFTVGEVVINTGSNGTNDLTQGFHQTNWNFLGVEDFAPDYQATIFPNPTQDVLNIKTSIYENVTYSLYDAQGKLVMQNILSTEQTPIQVSQLAPGSYSLELIFEDSNEGSLSLLKRKTFKIVISH